MRPRLLIHAHDWAPTVGGVQTVTMDLARGICEWSKAHPEEAWDVTVVTQTPAGGMDDSLLPFRVVRLPSVGQLFRLIRSTDVLHLAGPALLPLALGTLLRKPIVVEHHGFQAACPNGLLFFEPTKSPCPEHFMAGHYAKCVACNRPGIGLPKTVSLLAKTRLRRWLCNLGGINVAPSHWLGAVLKLKNTVAIYHGVSVACPATVTPASPPTIAFQGRLVSTKGVNLLLSAAAQLQTEGLNFRLCIIGDGPERAALESQARNFRDGTVSFLGQLPPEQSEATLTDVSIVAMPSLGGEVFGLVLAENMLRSKAVVVSDIGALQEVIGDAGIVVPTGSSADLAAALRRLLQDRQLTSRLGSLARARAHELFQIERMVAQHLDQYRKTIQP